MLRINGVNMKVSILFKDLVMKWIIGLMLKEEMQFGIKHLVQSIIGLLDLLDLLSDG